MTAGDGKPCKRCGTSDWYKGGDCKQCRSDRKRRKRAENPERAREADRRWYAENREKKRERNRRWYAENSEKARRATRRWLKANPEYKRNYREANPKKVRESRRRWKEANPEKVREQWHRRRARIQGNGGDYTVAEWKAVVRQQGGRCLACGKKKKLTVDHVIPLDMGGLNIIENIQGLCGKCNSSKGNKHIDYRPDDKGIRRWIQRKLFDE